MRIPPSVIVMSLVVAVPFGLAIKDTVNHDDPQSRAERESKRVGDELEAAQREYEALQAKDQAEHAKKQKARRNAINGLFGQTPASLGPTLDGVALGSPANAGTLDLFEHAEPAIHFESDANERITAITVALGSDYDEDTRDDCTSTKDHLSSLWGHDETFTWHDATQRQRVSIHGSDCLVRIERYFEAPDWLKNIPANLVGKTAAQALAMPLLDAPEVRTDEALTWYLPGLGRGNERTTLSATLVNKRIVATVATTVLAAEDGEAFIAAATAAFHGKPHHEDGDTAWEWKRTPPITIELDGTAMTMTAGKLPSEMPALPTTDGDL